MIAYAIKCCCGMKLQTNHIHFHNHLVVVLEETSPKGFEFVTLTRCLPWFQCQWASVWARAPPAACSDPTRDPPRPAASTAPRSRLQFSAPSRPVHKWTSAAAESKAQPFKHNMIQKGSHLSGYSQVWYLHSVLEFVHDLVYWCCVLPPLLY